MTLLAVASIEETNEQKLCKSCNKPLGPGRPDRQFCDAGCRSVFHNNNKSLKNGELKERKVAKLPQEVIRIQNILLRNREILADICGEEEKRTFKAIDMDGRGFSFKYFTSEEKTSDPDDPHLYRFCFEYGYWLYGNTKDYAVIVKRDRMIAY